MTLVTYRNTFLSVEEAAVPRLRANSLPPVPTRSVPAGPDIALLQDAIDAPAAALLRLSRARGCSSVTDLCFPEAHAVQIFQTDAGQDGADLSTISGGSPHAGMSPISSVEDVAGMLVLPPPPPPAEYREYRGMVPPPAHPPLADDWDHRTQQQQLAHARVPKTKNLKELYGNALSSEFTTIMVRNLPNRYKQRDFVDELALLGFPAGTWDFLYVPVDTHTNSSVGYAFVNFLTPQLARAAVGAFTGYRWRKFRKQTSKPAAVNRAHIQGLSNNVDHFSRTAIKDAKVKQHRPLVLAGSGEFSPHWVSTVANDYESGAAPGCYFVPIGQF